MPTNIVIPVQRSAYREAHKLRSACDHVPVKPDYNVRKDWFSVNCNADEICVGVLRERRHLHVDVAPTMLAPSRFRHDTCLTWYQTGSPYQMVQVAAYFLKAHGRLNSVEYRHVGVVDDAVAELCLDYRCWQPFEAGMLQDSFMPQQRWIEASLSALSEWLELYETSNRRMMIGGRFRDPIEVEGNVVYLIEAIGTDWVKIGKASGLLALRRLRQSQLCSPYRLRHLGVWASKDGRANKWERVLQRKLKDREKAKRQEWVRISKEIAIEKAEKMFL